MAKQTFTTGQVLTALEMTSLQATAMGGGAANTKTANYVLVAADAGTTVAMNAAGATTITVNTSLFAAGDTVFIQNIGAGACTITAGTATVATAGSLILPQNDAGILYFTSTGVSIFYDFIQVGAASPLTTKGDLYTFGTSDTRLPVGANGTILTADSVETTGLKWATPSSGALVKLASGTITGTSISFDNVFTTTYDNYYLFWNITDTDGAQQMRLRVGGADHTGSNYAFSNQSLGFSATPAWAVLSNGSSQNHWLNLPVGSPGSRYSWNCVFTGVDAGNLKDEIQYQGWFNRRVNSSGVIFGAFAAGTDFDGFTVYNTGSTFLGTYALYGYSK